MFRRQRRGRPGIKCRLCPKKAVHAMPLIHPCRCTEAVHDYCLQRQAPDKLYECDICETTYAIRGGINRANGRYFRLMLDYGMRATAAMFYMVYLIHHEKMKMCDHDEWEFACMESLIILHVWAALFRCVLHVNDIYLHVTQAPVYVNRSDEVSLRGYIAMGFMCTLLRLLYRLPAAKELNKPLTYSEIARAFHSN